MEMEKRIQILVDAWEEPFTQELLSQEQQDLFMWQCNFYSVDPEDVRLAIAKHHFGDGYDTYKSISQICDKWIPILGSRLCTDQDYLQFEHDCLISGVQVEDALSMLVGVGVLFSGK